MNDNGLAAIGALTGLTSLSLSGTNRFTDAGLVHLHRLKQFKGLNLTGTSLSEDALANLRSALPACEIRN